MTDRQHPYTGLPDAAFWRRSVSAASPDDVDPVGEFKLRIEPSTRVATAGSCFAQHIARYLRRSGFSYYVAESGHPLLPQAVSERHQYGTFSARYGNIYTTRQLVQLFERAYGRFEPVEDVWQEADGRVLDPWRPTVQPGGFVSVAEMHADRAQHLAAVRQMFETLDVFVFTLGLTECWVHGDDGAAFPVCPGVRGGVFDPDRHLYRNFEVQEVASDLEVFVHSLRQVNAAAHVVLTVSPVPLVATAEPHRHVLESSTYSKAVLRVAAEMSRKSQPHVHYFPSYEIITGQHARGRYFADDLRSVTEEGVAHVMRLFLRHTTGRDDWSPDQADKPGDTAQPSDSASVAIAEQLVEVECDELALDAD